MPVISIILVIAVLGVLVWLITTRIPMPPLYKNIIYIVALIAIILYLFRALGLWEYVSAVRI